MASTNKTTNYNLSQYIGSDKPTYLGDYNSDMLKIDTQMKTNADGISTVSASVQTALTDASTALTNANNAQSSANNAQSSADTAQSTATSALTKATTNENTINSIVSNITQTTLFENSNGTNANITLSETVENFDYIEIFFARHGSFNSFSSTKVFDPQGKHIDLSLVHSSNSQTMQIVGGRILIEGTLLTRENTTMLQVNNLSIASHSDYTDLYIYKIIGFKDYSAQ